MNLAVRCALTLWGALALMVAWSPVAHAQGNYKLAPVGGRTTLVGGTGLAFGADSSAAFLNPATVVRLDAGRLAFSVNFYQLSLDHSSSWYQPGAVDKARFGDIPKGGASFTTAGFDTLPGSLCLFLRVGEINALNREISKTMRESRARLGLCLASVQNDDFSLNLDDYSTLTGRGSTRQSQTFRQTFRRIAVGPTYAMYINNALAVGASLHASRSGVRSLIESTATTYAGGTQPIMSSFFSSAHGDSYDLTATAGVTYRFGAHQTVAAVFEAPSFHVFGSGGINKTVSTDGTGDVSSSSLTADGKFAAYTPMRLGIGTGIEEPWGSVELNVNYHLPTGSGAAYRATFDGRTVDTRSGLTNDQAATLALSTKAKGVVNIGVGGEVFVSHSIGILGGLSTDLSAAPSGSLVTDPLTFFPAHQDKVSTSFGIGSHGKGGDLLIGGELGYAWGQRLSVNSYQATPQLDTTFAQSYTLILVIAGTTSFQAIKRAVNDLTETLDPTTKSDKKAPPPITEGNPESMSVVPSKPAPAMTTRPVTTKDPDGGP